VANFFALDSAFHLAIGRASRNPYLLQAIEDARTNLFYPIGMIFEHLEDNADRSHQELFKAIDDRDPVAAEQAARDHIEATRTDLRRIRARAMKVR
jgi:DNA-binding GntR family transcriptional regulator